MGGWDVQRSLVTRQKTERWKRKRSYDTFTLVYHTQQKSDQENESVCVNSK